MFRSSLLAALLLIGISGTLAAQQPTEEQRAAIRSACRADFTANCSSVEPGTKAALMCLVSNEAKLSPACRTAVNAIAGQPAAPHHATPAAAETPPAAAQETPAPQPPPAAQGAAQDQLSAVRQACTLNDMLEHCSWIKPDSPEILLCLKANAAALSPSCRAAVGSGEATPAAPAAGAQPTEAAPPSAETAPAPPPPHGRPGVKRRASAPPSSGPPPGEMQKPSPEQISAIRAACRSDFTAHCRGVQPGTAEALQCLEQNSSQLSGRCRGAVAAIGGGGPPAGGDSGPPGAGAPGAEAQPGETAPPGDMPPPPRTRPGVKPRMGAAPPSAPPPGEAQRPSPEQISAVRAACRSDFMAHCRGVQPGTAEALQCLQQNSAQLSGSCRSAVAAIGGGGGAPPPGSESAPPGAAPPGAPGPAVGAAPPPGPMPMLAPGEAMFVMRACRMDRYRLCGDVPPGGGRILMCLAENAANVSPGCASALAAARR
jgi:hypothetical protein